MKSSVMKNESRIRLARIATCTRISSTAAVSTGRRASQCVSRSSVASRSALPGEAVVVDDTA